MVDMAGQIKKLIALNLFISKGRQVNESLRMVSTVINSLKITVSAALQLLGLQMAFRRI